MEISAQIIPSLADSSLVPGVVYVQFRDEISPDGEVQKIGSGIFDGLIERYQISAVRKAFPILHKVVQKTDHVSALERIYTVHFDTSYPPRQVALSIMLDSNVVYAEPKFIRYPRGQPLPLGPDDPLFETHQARYLELLKLPEAWEVVKGEQGDVVIAIVDDGVNWTHEDLQANAWTNPGEVPSNGIDDDQNGYVDDVHGYHLGSNYPYDPEITLHRDHGTHGTTVASMAVAVTDNGIGMAGSSWNARFISVGVQCDGGGGICAGIEGAVYAAANGADIINTSFGGSKFSTTESLAIRAVTDMGSLVIAAAGNESWNVDRHPSYPADYPRVLSVGATANDYDIVHLNYGTNVDVYAAGILVTGQYHGDYLHSFSGTSFSAPLVSGIAALIKTAFPTYNADQIREQIRFTADPVEFANFPEFEGLLGFGRVNAFRAVTETGIAGIVLDTIAVQLDGDQWRSGAAGHVEVTVRSYLEGSDNVEIDIVEAPDALEFGSRTAAVGRVPNGTSRTVEIPFTVVKRPGYRTSELFVVAAQAGDEMSKEAVLIPFEGWEIAQASSDKLSFDVTSGGNLGWLNSAHDYPDHLFALGRGIWHGEVPFLLREAGLILGTGPDQVSRSVMGIEARNPVHFWPDSDGLIVRRPGNTTPWESEVTLLDINAPIPTGLEILQEIHFDPGSRNSGFATVRYTITNPTRVAADNVHIGMLFHWTISDRWYHDIPGYNPDKGVGYQYTEEENRRVVMGAKILSDGAKPHFTVYDSGVYPFPRSESHWRFMSGGIQGFQSVPSYWGQVFGSGPYIIHPGESVEAAFAFFGGSSIDDMLLNADRAQEFYDAHFSKKARVQFLPVDSDTAVDLYINGQLVINHWQPESATKFLPLETGDTVLELRNAGDAKTSDPFASARIDLDPADNYHIAFLRASDNSKFVAMPNARRMAVSEHQVEFRAIHGIIGVPDLEVRIMDDHRMQIAALEMERGAVSRYTELEPETYLIELWDPIANTLLMTYQLDADSYAGRSFVLMMDGTISSGITVRGIWPDGSELVSALDVQTAISPTLPSELTLHGNYPNPFNPNTHIRFDLPMPAQVTVEVLDMIGRRVWQGPEEPMEAGYNHQYMIHGYRFASGVYLYRLLADTPSGILARTGQMVVVK